MTRPYSLAFKQKMIERMTGRDAVSALRLSKETGIRQQNLSRWLDEARSVPDVAKGSKKPGRKAGRSVEEKARLVMEAAKLTGEQLTAFLAREGVQLAELEQWRIALEAGATASKATNDRIRQLERELARKEKALAEAAALLVLKKKLQPLLGGDEDDDSDEENDT